MFSAFVSAPWVGVAFQLVESGHQPSREPRYAVLCPWLYREVAEAVIFLVPLGAGLRFRKRRLDSRCVNHTSTKLFLKQKKERKKQPPKVSGS